MHLLSAVFRAASSAASEALKTPNVHSEIVMSLSPSNNVRMIPTCGELSSLHNDLQTTLNTL